MESVHVFCGVNGLQDALGVNLWRKRELNEDAVHVVVAVQIFHNCEQIERAYRGGWRQQRTRPAEVLASGNFALYVDLRSGIFADKHRREARPPPCGRVQSLI